MSEKQSSRSRHQAPPISLRIHKSQRSRSISNGLEREPEVQPAWRLERRTSITSDLGVRHNIEKRNKVAQLIEHFEHSESTENVHRSVNNLHILSSTTPQAPAIRSANKTRTSVPKQKRESIKPLAQSISVPQQTSSSLETKVGTIVLHSTHSISESINSNDQTPCAIVNKLTSNHSDIPTDSQIVPSEPMAVPTPCSHPLLEGFIKCQSDEMIKSANDDTENSSDKSKTLLNERIKEIYATEVTYVKTLYVLSSTLPAKMKTTCGNEENLLETFNTIYKPLLDTIRRLYKFHYEIIFPHFGEYRTGHRTGHIWSILQDHFQTIEDLYKAYYITYNEYQRELKRLDKSAPLKKVHNAMLVCKVYLGNLCPITEFNCPNQRLLRYILLMKTYMKHFDENSTDYEHTSFIHDEFSRIAVRCEEQLMISSAELNRLKARVDNKLDCFDNQQLLWHGALKKQSARKRHDITQVYVILFSGCILVYDESGSKLELKRQLSIENITVDLMESRQIVPISSNIFHAFRVNAVEKSYEFLVEKESEREKWINKIQHANEDFKSRRTKNGITRFSDQQQIGIRAPVLVYDIDVTRCQICNTRFGLKLTPSGRHHCRACGRCVCGSCLTKKFLLKYRPKDGEVRICDTCYTLATGISINRHSISSIKPTRNPSKTILFGDFRCISSNAMIWIELQEDFQLHIYAGKLDQVEEYSINLPELRDIVFVEPTRTFILNGKEKRYKFSIELNHQNDYIDEDMKNIYDKPSFYAKLWYETMKSARLKTLPLWYIKKRHSADSGISAV